MLTIVVCVGSSCYVRGSEQVAETFERLIQSKDVAAQVELAGAYCMEQCSMGVSVQVGDRLYRGIEPRNAKDFFEQEVLPRLGANAGS